MQEAINIATPNLVNICIDKHRWHRKKCQNVLLLSGRTGIFQKFP